ncbi:MAG: DUF1015 family protein, partial [Kiritimatiellae bacterium]|nr:DUF1015 family protein [Kiritimatiellia bacterium]
MCIRDSHEPVEGLSTRLNTLTRGRPLYDFQTEDGVRQRVWRVEDWHPLARAFESVQVCHIADGHHRVAGAVDVALARRQATGNADEGANWFLAVLFAATELRILPYNRCVRDLGGRSPEDFLNAVRRRFQIFPDAPSYPPRRGLISMYLSGRWYGLTCPRAGPDPVTSLDVAILQEQLLAPILGINDPTRDPRIEFVGGLNGVAELMRRVDRGRCAVAFSLYPVSVHDVMAVANAGRIMPPKSTWFEPKLRSGLFAHAFDPANGSCITSHPV